MYAHVCVFLRVFTLCVIFSTSCHFPLRLLSTQHHKDSHIHVQVWRALRDGHVDETQVPGVPPASVPRSGHERGMFVY